MGGSSKKVTVGYKYYLGMHMIWCHGPVDKLLRIRVDKRDAWVGTHLGGPLAINAEGLFGGESREGGVSGLVDLEMGQPNQSRNSYLISKLGADVPAFRGVVGTVLRHCYLGINPYLKKWEARFQRIHVRQDGLDQWYDSKAAIASYGEIIGAGYMYWRYQVVDLSDPSDYSSPSFNDTGWPNGPSPFGDKPWTGSGAGVPAGWGFSNNPATVVPQQKKVWLRSTINLSELPTGGFLFDSFVDNRIEVWINGNKVITNYDTYGHYYSTTIPSSYFVVGENKIAVCGRDDSLGVRPENWFYFDLRLRNQERTIFDMNPAHIIRECLTDPDWGMGYAEADIDDPSFRAAADALFDEGMGISLLWDRQVPIEDFIKEIIKHIDAVLYVDRVTGKFVLKLIRGDYNTEDLLLLNEDNIVKLEGFQRTAFGELTNSVTVNYWDSETGNTASLTIQDIALAQMQGAVINTTVQYPGFTNSTIASRVAQRDLKSLSTPLITCTIYANQDAKDLNIGDVFLLSWDDYELDPTPMRVNSIAYGDGKKNQIKITAVQDVFALPTTAVVSTSPLPPVQSITPVPVNTRQVFEVPYLELVQVRGQTEIDNILAADPLAGFVGAAAIRPLSGAINARVLVDAGAGYEEIGALEFAPGAKLASSIGRTETTLPIQDGVDLDQVVLGTWLQCDSEIMAVTALSDTSITVKRGCLDTVPNPHAAGAALIFWDAYSQGDERQYASGETVKVKLQTVTGEDELPAEQAPEDVVTMSARAARPYPPGAVRINSQWFPEVIRGTEALSLSWAHRDRKQQTGQNLIGFTDGSIGPEPGTTYNLRMYGETDTLLSTESGLTGTAYNYSSELTDGGAGTEDPYWANVVSLLNFNGTDGSTTFIDETGKTWTAAGNAQIDTAQSKYGSAAGLFDGTGDYISTPDHADFDFGAGDFTIEAWIRVNAFANGGAIAAKGTPGADGYSLSLTNVSPYQKIALFMTSLGRVIEGTTSLALATWYHIALVRKGNVFTLYLNGLSEGSYTSSASLTAPGDEVRVGLARDGVSFFNGHIDDLRITKGIARYVENFTPPDQQLGQYSYASRPNGRLRFELESVRDGLTSYQKHNITVDRAGWGYNWGNYWGGI